tara:strand:- start:120 stop:350 length:231 start_codon:yes stop_codon:yes gene_type:complete
LKYNLTLKSDEERQAIEHHKQACLASHNINRVANGEISSSELSAWYKKQSPSWRAQNGAWFEASLAEANFFRNQRR